ncbi:MAG: LysR family transcriptional regulator [Clostridia bacterium]|nr:LysR family transcriptional regulator [Clostridia bacterium]
MNIVYLKYAIEVAKTGSINKAAENLYVAQPNLSRAIKELESSLGITIFQRTSKGMTLTPDGESLLQYSKSVLNQLDQIEEMFQKGQPNKQSFSISVPRATYISYAFAQFSKHIDENRPAEFFYKETNALRAINNVIDADYRLGIIRYAAKYDKYFKEMLEEKGLNYELVTEFTYSLIMNRESLLNDVEDIRFDNLKEYIEIAHADPFVPSIPLSKVKKEELPDDIDKRIFVFERASQFDILSANPDTFMWVSPIPQPILDKYELVQRSCSENTKTYKDVLIYKKDYKLTKLDKAFITELCEAKRSYIK